MTLTPLSMEAALRWTEILLSLALLQQAAEHLTRTGWERRIFALRSILALAVLFGIATPAALVGLTMTGIYLLLRFDGPYNGGADRMGLLVLLGLTLATLADEGIVQELALGYVGLQLVLSYAQSGWVKLANSEWWHGRALAKVFCDSMYPVSTKMRGLGQSRSLMLCGSWAVIGLEVAFPLALLSLPVLVAALIATTAFHLANAILFGLNRFLWTWITAFPAVLWLQARLFAG